MVNQHGEKAPSLLNFTSNPLNGETDDLIKITRFKNQDCARRFRR